MSNVSQTWDSDPTEIEVPWGGDKEGTFPATLLAVTFPASDESTAAMLSLPIEDDNGRSPWTWVRLANGDLIFGTLPQSEDYFAMERLVEADYEAAEDDDDG